MAAIAKVTVAMEQAFQDVIEFISGAENDFGDFKVDTRTLTRQTAPKAKTMTIPVKRVGKAVEYTGTYSGTGTTHDVEAFIYDRDFNNVDKYDPKVFGDVCETEQSVLMEAATMYEQAEKEEIPKICINALCKGAGRKVVKTDGDLTPSNAYEIFTEIVSMITNTDKTVANDYSTKAQNIVCFMSDRFHALLKTANKNNGLIVAGATPRIENNNIVSLDGVEIRVQDNGIMYDAYEKDVDGVFNPKADANEVDLIFVPRNTVGNITFLWDTQYVKIVNSMGVDGDYINRGYRATAGAKVINLKKANVVTLTRGTVAGTTVEQSVAATGRTVTAKRTDALVE